MNILDILYYLVTEYPASFIMIGALIFVGIELYKLKKEVRENAKNNKERN